MQTSVPSAEVLLFHCGYCHAELSVPLALRGVVGPCPCCSQQIQAPLADRRLQLPPVEECLDEPMPQLPHWMGLPAGLTLPVMPESNLPSSDRGVAGNGLMPRQLAEHDSLGFRAKLTIAVPGVEVGETGSDGSPRSAPVGTTERGSEDFMRSRVLKGVRMTLMVTTGGLCAALALFLRDRQWVLELPWRPQAGSSVVEVPVRNTIVRTKAMDPAEPFTVEDPADLEVVDRRPSLAPLPLPETRTVPIHAAPIASGKNQPPRAN